MTTEQTTAIAEFSATEAGIAELRSRFDGVIFEVTTPAGMADARKGRRELVDLRVGLEKMRQELKAPILERGKLLDAEAKRITALILPLELAIDSQIVAEEARKETARRERVRIEEERVAAIKRRIDGVRQAPLSLMGCAVGVIQAAIIDLSIFDVDEIDEAYRAEATIVVKETIARLTQMRDARKEADAEAKRLAAERAELDRQQAEQRAEQARQDAERTERLRREDEERAAAQRAEDETRAAQRRSDEAIAAEQARVVQAERDRIAEAERAENARIAEENRIERVRLETERAAREAIERETRAAELQAEIDGASLVTAATDAVQFLELNGFGDEFVTRKLSAAISRHYEGTKG